jgi:hypothetical protein
MEHVQLTLASDEHHDLALEKCDCGQYSLSIGSVTVHMEEETARALARMLADTVLHGERSHGPFTMAMPQDVQ